MSGSIWRHIADLRSFFQATGEVDPLQTYGAFAMAVAFVSERPLFLVSNLLWPALIGLVFYLLVVAHPSERFGRWCRIVWGALFIPLQFVVVVVLVQPSTLEPSAVQDPVATAPRLPATSSPAPNAPVYDEIVGFDSEYDACYRLLFPEDDAAANEVKARRLCERANNAGDLRATLLLGHIYDAGLGVEEDKVKALGYYEQASWAGDPDGSMRAFTTVIRLAQENRSRTFLEGNRQFADQHLTMALEAGHYQAAEAMEIWDKITRELDASNDQAGGSKVYTIKADQIAKYKDKTVEEMFRDLKKDKSE